VKVLVTGSAGHLGEALVRILRDSQHEVVSVDILPSPFTTCVGSITNPLLIANCMTGVEAVIHTAALHRPHIDTHSQQHFVEANVSGTLNLLEQAVSAGVKSFVFTSTTSVFGDALVPPTGAPAAWITEEVKSIPKNIYGVTKEAAENLCQLFHRNAALPCIVLRISRFFPEEDFDQQVQEAYPNDNMKVNEYLYRRIDLEDAVSACLLAAERAPNIGFDRYIVSATTPFGLRDLPMLRTAAPLVVQRLVPDFAEQYAHRGWKMVRGIDRVYVNARARNMLGWHPRYDFKLLIENLRSGQDTRSPLARLVGSKGYS
jgi:UDP-glucose 4-epimerase